jgi:hypothetical protein
MKKFADLKEKNKKIVVPDIDKEIEKNLKHYL